jgi:Zn-dependent protease with chaperone function
MQNLPSTNPTAIIDLDFDHYLQSRTSELNSHLVGGIPDYAFSLDGELRQQLTAMGPVRAIAQSLVSFTVPYYKQIQNMQGVAVSPQQYPEIYAIGEDCAKRLGIGIPQIFVYFSPLFNAYTIATDNVAPMIVISSALVEALEPQELKFVIGHECGHIHNLHGVYNTAVELMTNGLAKVILHSIPALGVLEGLIQGGLMLFFLRWSRCAEITCDRAGLICCGDSTTAQIALAKLVTGGGGRLQGINIQEYLKQICNVQSTPVRLLELFATHPLIPKRIEAIRLFADCELFYSWRPELQFSTASIRSKIEVDDLCKQFINVLNQGYQPQVN